MPVTGRRLIYMSTEPLILLVEDSADDVFLIRRALKKAGFQNPVHVVCNGKEAMAYLNGEGNPANRQFFPLPSLVLLDLRLPDLSGLAVLGWIRDQEHLRSLRVAVLTASENPNDVSAAHALGATLFLTKPLRVQEIVRLMEMLSDKFWFPAECGPMGQLIQSPVEDRLPPA